MKRSNVLSSLSFCASAGACLRGKHSAAVELVISSFDPGAPVAWEYVKTEKWADQSCVILGQNCHSLALVELRFTCIPSSASTGFEKPGPEIKINQGPACECRP